MKNKALCQHPFFNQHFFCYSAYFQVGTTVSASSNYIFKCGHLQMLQAKPKRIC